MFREIEDSKIDYVTIPWHGLITDGTLTLPSGAQIMYASAGNNTYLFDAGVPPMATPPEIAAAGGEVWNRAIVNFGGSRAAYHCGLTSRGKSGLPLRIPGSRRPIENMVIDLDLGPASAPRLRYAPAGAWIERPLTLADIGQSGGPDIHVATVGGVARPTRYALEIMDVRGGSVLCIVRGSAPGATDVLPLDRLGELSEEYIPSVPLALVELVFGSDGNWVGIDKIRLIEGRDAALGTLQFAQSYSNTLEDVSVIGSTVWTGGEDIQPPSCSGTETIIATVSVGPASLVSGAQVKRAARGARHDHFEQSMIGALLAARYDVTGAIQTARYDAIRKFDHEYSSTIEPEGTCTITRTFTFVFGYMCEPDAPQYSGVAYAMQRVVGEFTAEHTLTLYGFDGQQVDSATVLAHGTANFARAHIYIGDGTNPSTGEWLASISTPFGETSSTNDTFYDSLESATNTIGRYPDVPTAVAPFDGLGWAMVDHDISLIRYSNNLFGLVAVDFSDSPLFTYRLRPALHWAGSDAREFEIEREWSAAEPLREHIRAMSGASYNPVTHEVARGEYGKTFSWV